MNIMKKKEFILIIVITFSINSTAQIVRMSGLKNYQPDTTSMFSGKYFWNLSKIVNMMEWIDNKRDGCPDSVYVSELNTVYSELETLHKSRLNFSMLDSQINRLNTNLEKAWKDYYLRSSPFRLIQKEILSKKPDDIDQLVLDGIQFRENNKLDSAYLNFKKAIEKDSTRINYYYLIIDTELELNNNSEKALEYVNKVINRKNELTSYVFDPYKMRVGIYINQKQFKLAYDDLNLLLEKDSNDLNSLYDRAFVKTDLKDFAGSISDYQILLKKYQRIPFRIYVDTTMIFNNIGWNYYCLKQYELCVQYANKSLQIKPNKPSVLDTRGSGYYGLCEYEKCISDMTKAIELKPDLANSFYLRGLSYLKLNKQNLAYVDLSAAYELGVVEASDALKGLSLLNSDTKIENQKQFPKQKTTNSKNNIRIDPYGIHFFFK